MYIRMAAACWYYRSTPFAQNDSCVIYSGSERYALGGMEVVPLDQADLLVASVLDEHSARQE